MNRNDFLKLLSAIPILPVLPMIREEEPVEDLDFLVKTHKQAEKSKIDLSDPEWDRIRREYFGGKKYGTGLVEYGRDPKDIVK